MNTSHERRGLPRVPAQPYEAKLKIRHVSERGRRLVGASIVHNNDFMVEAERVEGFAESREQVRLNSPIRYRRAE